MHKVININYMIVLISCRRKKYKIKKGIEGIVTLSVCFVLKNKIAKSNMATFIKASWCVKRY